MSEILDSQGNVIKPGDRVKADGCFHPYFHEGEIFPVKQVRSENWCKCGENGAVDIGFTHVHNGVIRCEQCEETTEYNKTDTLWIESAGFTVIPKEEMSSVSIGDLLAKK